MSDIVEKLADDLAQATIAAAEELGEPELIEQIAKMIGSTSQTSQEIFMTAVRVRLAIRRGHVALEQKLEAARASGQKRQKMDLSTRKIMNVEEDGSAGGH